VSVVRRSQPDIGSSSSLNRFQIDGDVVQARGVRLALDPSIVPRLNLRCLDLSWLP
jgi:hypothetical protein